MDNALMREFKLKLEESLDTHFPKGKCKERGRALMLFAEACVLTNRLIIKLEK